MADVVQSQTVEINDAVFCLAHFKEVVRPTLLPFSPSPTPVLILLSYVCVRA